MMIMFLGGGAAVDAHEVTVRLDATSRAITEVLVFTDSFVLDNIELLIVAVLCG
jgi:hypothetical protein